MLVKNLESRFLKCYQCHNLCIIYDNFYWFYSGFGSFSNHREILSREENNDLIKVPITRDFQSKASPDETIGHL